MKCELCGGEMKKDDTQILTSNISPPMEIYVCEKCHHNQYVEFGEYKNKPYLTGWVCPKCGAVMSPYQNTCTNCSPPKKLEVWC